MLALLLTVALAVDPATCGECHTTEYARWRTSRHAAAATNPVFTAAWEHWPNGWCLQCHAPAPDQQVARLGRIAVPGVLHSLPSEEPGPRWADGVDCATCHLDGEVVLTHSAPTAAGEAVHDMRQEPALGDERLCATCHEFTLQNHSPAWPFTKGDTPAQETITEWRSSNATQSCIDCHMGEHGHGFPGGHTPSLVRQALQTTATMRADGTVLVRVASPGAAHRVPTGDPFRRLEIELCTGSDCVRSVASKTLRRVFELTDTTWVLLEDRSVPPETAESAAVREIVLTPSTPVTWWRLHYRYGDAQFEASLPAEEVGFLISEGPVLALETP